MIQNRVRLNTLTQKRYAHTNSTGTELIAPNELGIVYDTLFSRDGLLYLSILFDTKQVFVQVPFHDIVVLPPKVDKNDSNFNCTINYVR